MNKFILILEINWQCLIELTKNLTIARLRENFRSLATLTEFYVEVVERM